MLLGNVSQDTLPTNSGTKPSVQRQRLDAGRAGQSD